MNQPPDRRAAPQTASTSRHDDGFFSLTPERVLDAVEVGGRRATGYAFAHNSLENRVYEVELEDETRLVAKFYRPGRWSREAIVAEHSFLAELAEADVPVVPPLDLRGLAAAAAADGRQEAQTLASVPGSDGAILYAAFPKVRGRPPEDLTTEQLERLGRLLARLHLVGARATAPARPTLTPEYYGAASVRLIAAGTWIPDEDLASHYLRSATALVELCQRAFARFADEQTFIRIHGDCHLGNLLWGKDGPFFLDFDDFLRGPPVQDLWLIAPGRDEDAIAQRAAIVSGYQSMRDFDRRSLALVEPLRALRILRYAAWIAQRWQDPAFQHAFPDFTERSFWQREVASLDEQLAWTRQALSDRG